MNLQQLNKHPLNQAALRRLRQERLGNLYPRQMPILQLARHGLQDNQGNQPQEWDRRQKALEDYSLSPVLQEAALGYLNQAVSPEEVNRKPLPELANQVGEALRKTLRG